MLEKMPSNPESIKRFLASSFAPLPAYKTWDAKQCHALIARVTGVPFKPKTIPRLYQLQGIAAALASEQFLLFYDMQLGKTLMALEWAEHLRRANLWKGPGLIIAHSPTGLEVWRGEAARHSDLSVRIVRTNPNELIEAIEQDVDLIVMTWSGLQQIFCEKRLSRKKELKLYANKELCSMMAESFELFIIDEIHRAKNPYGLWFDLAEQLSSKAVFRLGLTGTPINRDPYALWAQLKLIDKGYRLSTVYNFFCEAFGKRIKNYARGIDEWVFNPAMMPILSERLASCSLSYTRPEAGIEIVLNEQVVRLHMSGKQLDAYSEAIGDVIRLNEKTEVWSDDNEIKYIFSRLRQIASGYEPFTDAQGARRTVRFANSVKLEWLIDFLDEIDETPGIIIFCEHIESVNMITEMLMKKKRSFVKLYGGTTAVQNTKSITDFQAGRAQIFLANHQSGGTSIMLNRADYVIYYESPVAPIDRAQSQARPMANRGGRPLFITDLVCAPVEARILEFIAEGRDLVSALRDAKTRTGLISAFAIKG
jgi:SNF2 family DNA or RNA helicase